MPIYNLYCEDCNLDIEIECPISKYDSAMKNIVCPECTSRNVHRNYSHDNIYSSVKSVKTIGQLADKNAKLKKSSIQEELHKKKESTPEALKLWYKDSKYGEATPKEINKMNDNQKLKYIMEGKK
jgi:hypothetical protein